MIRLAPFAFVVLIAACQENYVDEVRHGMFVERNFMYRVDDTLETGLRYIELCNEKTNKCYRSDHQAGLEAWFPFFDNGKFVFVTTNNVDADIVARTVLIFRTRDGMQLKCSNCAQDDFEHPLGRASISDGFGKLVIQAPYENRGTKERRVYSVSIREDTFAAELIETVPSGYELVSRFYSGGNGELLWIDCRSGCQLVTHRLDNGERRSAPAPACEENKRPILEWQNGVPTPTCRYSGTSGTPIVQEPGSE